MPRYFFDIHDNGKLQRDDERVELDDIAMVRKEAQRILPSLANDEIPNDGDHRSYTVMVTDADGRPVYSAMLNYAGTWMLR